MKVKTLIETEGTDGTRAAGTIIDHPDAWRLCDFIPPAAVPVDDEAREACKAGEARREKIRNKLHQKAEQAMAQQAENEKVEEALRHSEFEQVLKEGL